MNKAFLIGFYKAAGVSKFIAEHGIKSLGKDAPRLMAGVAKDSNPLTTAITALLLKKPAELLLGKKRVRTLGKHFNSAFMNADMIVGKPLDKVFGKMKMTKNLFKTEEMIPLGGGKFKKIHRTSIAEPLKYTAGIGMPIYTAGKLSEDIEKRRSRKNEQGTI